MLNLLLNYFVDLSANYNKNKCDTHTNIVLQ